MERLTMWHDGNHAICADEDCTSDGCPFADAPCEHVQEVIDLLAAYEDTGLEPDGIDEALNEAHDLGYQACLNYKGSTWSEAAELQAYRALGTVEELAALVKAQDEGRVVAHGRWSQQDTISHNAGYGVRHYYHAECPVAPCRLFDAADDYCPSCGARMDGGEDDGGET